MAYQERAITVEQNRRGGGGATDTTYCYIVRQAVNTTTPKIGQELDEDALKGLMIANIKVTIKPAR